MATILHLFHINKCEREGGKKGKVKLIDQFGRLESCFADGHIWSLHFSTVRLLFLQIVIWSQLAFCTQSQIAHWQEMFTLFNGYQKTFTGEFKSNFCQCHISISECWKVQKLRLLLLIMMIIINNVLLFRFTKIAKIYLFTS